MPFCILIFIFGVCPSIKKYRFNRKKKFDKKSLSYEFNSRELEKIDSRPPPPSFPPPEPPKINLHMKTFKIQTQVTEPQSVNPSTSNIDRQGSEVLDFSIVNNRQMASPQSNSSLYTLTGHLRGLTIQPKRNF